MLYFFDTYAWGGIVKKRMEWDLQDATCRRRCGLACGRRCTWSGYTCNTRIKRLPFLYSGSMDSVPFIFEAIREQMGNPSPSPSARSLISVKGLKIAICFSTGILVGRGRTLPDSSSRGDRGMPPVYRIRLPALFFLHLRNPCMPGYKDSGLSYSLCSQSYFVPVAWICPHCFVPEGKHKNW